jgi:hypothetical protein
MSEPSQDPRKQIVYLWLECKNHGLSSHFPVWGATNEPPHWHCTLCGQKFKAFPRARAELAKKAGFKIPR